MIEIRPAIDADKPQVLQRIEQVFGSGLARRSESLWDWRWIQDPRLPSPGYRGVVAEWRGNVIGNLATVPAGLLIAGRPTQAWWFVDVLVHWGLTRQAIRERRKDSPATGPDLSRGVAMALFDHPAAGPIQLGKHVSAAMSVIGGRAGFTPIAETGGLHRRISTRYPVQRWLGAPAGDLVGAALDLTIRPSPRPALPVEVFEGPFDARFDALWGSARVAYPAICRRDAALLNWRYRQHPDVDYRVLSLDGDDGLRGYCVVSVYQRPGPRDRRLGAIVDLLTLPEDRAARQALLAGAVRALRRLRVERAEAFYCGSELGRMMAALGFQPKVTGSGGRPLWMRNLPEAARGLYVTQGDGDGG